MGRRRAGKRQAIQDGEEGQDGADCAPLNALRLNDEDADVLPVIAAHPSEAVFATAFGANVRVYDARCAFAPLFFLWHANELMLFTALW
jgi:hypothetical protein